MDHRRYYHLLPQQEIDEMVKNPVTYGYLKENFKQPDWCKYPGALNGDLGCWSLTDTEPDGLRTKISHDFCRGCDCYSGDRDTYIDFESE